MTKYIKKPLLANMVEGGKTPFLNIEELKKLGFKIGLYPITLLLSVAHTLQKQLKHLNKAEHKQIQKNQVSFEDMKSMIGFSDYDEMQEKYVPKF